MSFYCESLHVCAAVSGEFMASLELNGWTRVRLFFFSPLTLSSPPQFSRSVRRSLRPWPRRRPAASQPRSTPTSPPSSGCCATGPSSSSSSLTVGGPSSHLLCLLFKAAAWNGVLKRFCCYWILGFSHRRRWTCPAGPKFVPSDNVSDQCNKNRYKAGIWHHPRPCVRTVKSFR